MFSLAFFLLKVGFLLTLGKKGKRGGKGGKKGKKGFKDFGLRVET